jgi:hypothetical protein
LSRQPNRDKLITVVPANAEQQIVEVVQAALSVNERIVLTQSLVKTM